MNYDYLLTGETSAIRENGATSGIGVLATFAYDDLGRRTSLTRGNTAVTTYAYIAIDRLWNLTQNLTGTTNDLTIGNITYNPASQIITTPRSNDLYAWTGHGSGSTAGVANGLNQLTSIGGSATAHDARGNLTTDPTSGKTYGYSSENLLKSATGGVTLAYDPMLRLYDVTGAATTRFAYDGLDAIAEYDAANALQRRFVHGPGIDEPLVQYEGASTTDRRFLHADERGSVIATSDASGNMLTINKYDEFGKPQSTNAGRFQYTGQMWLPELGAYYYKARVYSATLGRFLQTDPIDVAGGINLYAYVGNDPVNWLDPLGLQTPPILTGWDPGCSICNATAFINGTDIVITAQASGGDGGAWLGGGMTGGVGNGRSPIAGFNPRGGGGGEARPQRNICRSAYSGANAVSDLAGDIALGADTVAMGAAVAAVITSETIVGGLTFGAIAAGAKLVSLGASGVRAVVQFTSGNNRGGQSTLIGLGIGVVTPPLLKAKQGIYGIGNSARDRLVQETHGIAAGELASEALCTGS